MPHQGAGWFLVIDLQGEYEQALYMGSPTGLHPGEAMSLAIGAHRGWGFLTDDRGARRYAAKLGVTVTGTVGLLHQFINQDAISIDQGNEVLAQMIERARYHAPITDLRTLL